MNPDSSPEPDEKVCLARIEDAYQEALSAYYDIESKLREFYRDQLDQLDQ